MQEFALMKTRTLGTTGPTVSAIGYGCMGLDFGYAKVSRQEGIAMIRAAHERGVTFFDTAEVYGPWTNEDMVGEALEPFKGQVVIATKFGFNIDPETGAMHQPPGADPRRARGSLKRLRVDRLDVFYQHRVDPNVPIEDAAPCAT
jgi:aryl-alcohol dehydrogenase-like predicted oxidoreductase